MRLEQCVGSRRRRPHEPLHLESAVTYGVVNVGNLDIQPGEAFHQTQRTSFNLTWNPVPFVDLVFEFLAGSRVNKSGQRASASQFQTGWTLKF